ncbi:MAG: hypothetical protein NZ518_10555, partial [Dehalococcoidia bacterium]|nr:hypothetical protein [Dehalococcoidia bacterium]
MSDLSVLAPPRVVRLGSLVVAMAVTLAACAPAAPTASPAPAASDQPQLAERQTLTIGTSALPPTPDPQLSVSGTVRRFDMFETLVAPDRSFQNIEPLLAERWETVTPTTWRFTLRPN